jgi:hypothetical protein
MLQEPVAVAAKHSSGTFPPDDGTTVQRAGSNTPTCCTVRHGVLAAASVHVPVAVAVQMYSAGPSMRQLCSACRA